MVGVDLMLHHHFFPPYTHHVKTPALFDCEALLSLANISTTIQFTSPQLDASLDGVLPTLYNTWNPHRFHITDTLSTDTQKIKKFRVPEAIYPGTRELEPPVAVGREMSVRQVVTLLKLPMAIAMATRAATAVVKVVTAVVLKVAMVMLEMKLELEAAAQVAASTVARKVTKRPIVQTQPSQEDASDAVKKVTRRPSAPTRLSLAISLVPAVSASSKVTVRQTAPPSLQLSVTIASKKVTEAFTCENPRKIDRSHIADVPGEVAWEQLRAAVADHDLDDVKEAAEKYIKANPDATYLTLEKAFRSQGLNIYLVAIEKELAMTYTNMDLQGNLGKKYTIQWRWSPKAARPKEAEGWPTPEENLERLADAGVPIDRGIPKCSNCEQLGHTRNKCDQEKNEAERAEVKCYNCDGVGHRVRDCPNPREDKFACRNCKKSGHSSKECPEPRSAEGVECKKCGEVGHFSRDCPQGGGSDNVCRNCGQEGHRKSDCTNDRVIQCRNCDAWGHASKECKEPKDWSRVKCSVCEEMGHTKVRCPQAKALEADGEAGHGGDDFGGSSAVAASYGGADDFGAPAAIGGDSWESAPVTSGW